MPDTKRLVYGDSLLHEMMELASDRVRDDAVAEWRKRFTFRYLALILQTAAGGPA
jgi:hypothetical protein